MSEKACNDPCKHLEFIQAVITRLAQNSFLIKGWSVTLLTGLLLLVLQQERAVGTIFLIVVPAVVFWWLDAYYLHLERGFRGLYELVAREPSSSFSMKAPPYSLGAHFKAACSPGVWPLYLTYVLVGIVAYCLRGG